MNIVTNEKLNPFSNFHSAELPQMIPKDPILKVIMELQKLPRADYGFTDFVHPDRFAELHPGH